MATITDTTFIGVKWDGEAIEAVNMIAEAILNMTELFKAQNINIGSLLSVNENGTPEAQGQEIEEEHQLNARLH